MPDGEEKIGGDANKPARRGVNSFRSGTTRAIFLRKTLVPLDKREKSGKMCIRDRRCSVLFGGVSQNPQVEALARGVDILIATPGRLNDLIGQGYVHLDDVQTFVLDEADRMLDMGFVHDVKRVIAKLPIDVYKRQV